MSIKEINEKISKFDKAADEVRDAIIEYLDKQNRSFYPPLQFSYDEDLEIKEISGETSEIVTEDDFTYDYRDFRMYKLIALFDAISEEDENE
jgi:hypothetical protein